MPRRKLENLNLLDNFLFGTIVTHPVWGERFSRILLETIFQRKFGGLKILPQKVQYGKDTDRHGARLDVYVEELPEGMTACQASVYDMEPDRKDMSPAELSRRTRFYHALIDADCLKSGENYETLKNVIVIFILSRDPFGAGRMVYTICNSCREEPEIPYDDGAQTLFLYTKGTRGRSSEVLHQLLRYMEDSTEENAVNPVLKEIHHMVESVRQNREVELSYMKSWEWEEEIRKEAVAAGLAEGRAKGIEEGLSEGRREGRKEGRKEERVNTERERRRADLAEAELQKLRAKLAEYEKDPGVLPD